MIKFKEGLIFWVVITFVPVLFVAACVSFVEMSISFINPYYWEYGVRAAFCGYASVIAVIAIAVHAECYDL